MRKLILSLAAVLAVPAFAGQPMVSSGKTMATPMVDKSCFDAGWTLSGFAAYLIPDSDASETWGGGAQVDYFFGPYVGIAASGTWSDVANLYYADLTLRAPMGIVAPYAIAGIGAGDVDGDWDLVARAGAGLDVRIWDCHGLFADWTYNWADNEEIEDFQIVRFGLRFQL